MSTPPLNRAQVIEELKRQVLVASDTATAEFLADKGTVATLMDGHVLTEQGKVEDLVYFIIDGKVNVFVSHHYVGTRVAGQHVGEMIVVHPASTRSATCKAAGRVVVCQVPKLDFEEALERNPHMWKPLARTIAERLREREKMLRPRNLKPVMFLGCATEGIKVADLVLANFEHKKSELEIRPWYFDVFEPSTYSIDSLLEEAKRADFAVLVAGPDDTVTSRKATSAAPRDNVIFELGLFMGALGRQRVIILQQKGVDLKIPSDLKGLPPLEYTTGGGPPTKTDLHVPCGELWKVIEKHGVI